MNDIQIHYFDILITAKGNFIFTMNTYLAILWLLISNNLVLALMRVPNARLIHHSLVSIEKICKVLTVL